MHIVYTNRILSLFCIPILPGEELRFPAKATTDLPAMWVSSLGRGSTSRVHSVPNSKQRLSRKVEVKEVRLDP